MKKLTFILVLFITTTVYAQQDTLWRTGGLFALNFAQATLTNWAAGGQNSIAGNSIVNYFANYKRGKNAWDTNLDLGYGLIIQGDNGKIIKSDDKIDFSSKYGIKAVEKWYYSALINFRSQFTTGYKYPNDSLAISNFFAPAYLIVGLGMDYKPTNYFSLFLSPATARFIFVNDKLLSDAGAFGVDKGKKLKIEAGAFIKAAFKKDLNPILNLQTSIDLFGNYLNKPENIVVNWQMLMSLKVSKFLSASFSAQLIYDDNSTITFYKSDGITIDHAGPRTQFKQVLGIGLAYKFSGVTVK